MKNRTNPNDIEQDLKEAVAEALLGRLYNTVSGEGEPGRIVVANRPSRKFVSGFLEPTYVARKGPANIDESANPIHIITTGMDFQVIGNSPCSISVAPKFSIYVRILPSTDDLKKHRIHLELSKEAKAELWGAVRAVEIEFKKKNQSLRDQDRKKFYDKLGNARRDEVNKAFTKFGVDLSHLEVSKEEANSEEEILQSESLMEGESQEEKSYEDSEEAAPNETELNFVVYPGSEIIIPELLVKRIRPIQKWLRLELDNPPDFSFDASASLSEISDIAVKESDRLNQAISDRLRTWLADQDPDTGGKLWAYPKNLMVTPNQVRDWDATLEEIRAKYHNTNRTDCFALPDIQLGWSIDARSAPENADFKFVKVALENLTDHESPTREERDESVFQVSITTTLSKSSHVNLRLDRVKPSYRYNKYLSYPAIGFNAGITTRTDRNQISLTSTWLPIYRQPRIQAREYTDIDVSFAQLSTHEGTKKLNSLPLRFLDWIKNTENSVDPTEGSLNEDERTKEKERFDQDIISWKNESKKIARGINLLTSSAASYVKSQDDSAATPIRAWTYMNEVMQKVGERSGYDTWRLFQVAFILANISGFASRIEEYKTEYDADWDESVALLYFSTGGGKTEAFFGLLVFSLFLDRLRGKSNGVTAMLRYPLRLLTIQQAQRLSRILAVAEEVRWQYELGGQAFEIGFWVGRSNTPNRRSQITKRQIPTFQSVSNPDEEKLKDTPDYRFAMENWNKLPNCPFCNTSTVLRRYPRLGEVIGHACTSDDCAWNVHHGGAMKQPLPFYIVDDDIYDFAPAVLLGTIDKLALIGHSDATIRRVFGMLGLAQFHDTNTGRLVVSKSPADLRKYEPPPNVKRLFPVYSDGERHFFDPFPSMIIQDETHLLEESLGTFSGIFQTLFEQVLGRLAKNRNLAEITCTTPSGNIRMPKIIAATATVMEPERQMEALYQRDVAQFPFPGPSIYESFYSTPLEPTHTTRKLIEDIELRAHRARLYASVLTNGRPHTSTSVEILGYFHFTITQLLLGLNSSTKSEEDIARRILAESITQSEISSHYIDSILKADAGDLATLIDLHRIALTYVTNKKGGDQIMAAESDTSARIHEDAGIDFDALQTELISGSVDAGEIEAVIRKAEERPEPGAPLQYILEEGLVRAIVATSAISHGVDVNELNSMFFAGMPSDTSEYIQASSRIGRTHVGFSLLIPTPQRRRDRYILEVNDIYHRFLERMIRPAAVDRWAESALTRALPSIFFTYIIAVVEQSRLLEFPENQKHKAGDFGRLRVIEQQINDVGIKNFTDEVAAFVKDAVGLTHSKFGPSAVDQIGDILEEEIKNGLIQEILGHVNEFESLSSLFEFLDHEFHNQKKSPMTSLRDVDPAGSIRYTKASSRVSAESAYDIIRTIRKGTSGGPRNA